MEPREICELSNSNRYAKINNETSCMFFLLSPVHQVSQTLLGRLLPDQEVLASRLWQPMSRLWPCPDSSFRLLNPNAKYMRRPIQLKGGPTFSRSLKTKCASQIRGADLTCSSLGLKKLLFPSHEAPNKSRERTRPPCSAEGPIARNSRK